MGIADKINELNELKKNLLAMGGAKAVAKHKKKGRLTARERLNALFDPDTFRELDMFVKHRCVNFGMESVDIPADGVITGYGRVDGRLQRQIERMTMEIQGLRGDLNKYFMERRK